MRDRVAEVLAERATLDRGAAAGLAVALAAALHVVAATAIVYTAMHHAAPVMDNVLTIKFTPLAAPKILEAPAAPKRQPVKAGAAAALHEEVPKPKPVPVPVKNTAPPDAFGRSTKKPAAELPQPVPIPAPAT